MSDGRSTFFKGVLQEAMKILLKNVNYIILL